MDSLERRYRLLLYAYPSGYRRRRGDEIVGTFLDLAAPGQTRPSLADAADVVVGGFRARVPLPADLLAGWALAGPVALALAAGLSGFLWLSVEPLYRLGFATVGTYAAWLLALVGWVALPARYTRWPVGLAMAATALSAAADPRPPLWILLVLLAFGGLALTAPAPRGATVRLAVVTGAVVTAALGKWLLAGARPGGYYQPVLPLAGIVVAVAVAGLAASGVWAARERRPVRPWLFAALLLALPGGWLGPRGAAAGPGFVGQHLGGTSQPEGFGRLAEVLLATCVVLAAMAALSGVRGAAQPVAILDRAGGVALGCAAGYAGYLGWGTHHWGYAVWLLALLVPWRPVTGLAMAVSPLLLPFGTPLVALVLLGFVALLCPRGRPVPVALAMVAAAATVTWYDNDWHLPPTVPFGHSAGLVLLLTLVPFTVAAFAGAASLRRQPLRAVPLLATGTGWVGWLTVPHLAAWGPILVLVPVLGAAVGTLVLLRRFPRR